MRAWHATRTEAMTAGEDSTATMVVFTNILLRHIREEKPDRVVVCWDGGGSDYRLRLLPSYKGTRTKHLSMRTSRERSMIKQFLSLAGVFSMERSGVEADDLIAKYWHDYQGEYKMVTISGGREVKVSPEDYARVAAKTWSVSGGYARNGTTKDGQYAGVLMHRFIAEAGEEDFRSVDHINGDPFDNRRPNLRLVTHAQNHQNRQATKTRGSSRYRGVSWYKRKSKWLAYGYLDGKMHNLGYFDDEEEAADTSSKWRAENMPFSEESGNRTGLPSQDRIVVVSEDKDFLQIVGQNPYGIPCTVLRSTGEPWDLQDVIEKTGTSPENLPLVMALTGDTSDNVIGVPRIGPVRAIQLLNEAGWSLEAIEDPRVREMLPQVRLNRVLVNLRLPLPGLELAMPPLFEPTTREGALFDGLLEFLEQYQLKALSARAMSGTLWSTDTGAS